MTTDSVIVSNIAGHLPTTCLPNNVVSQFQNLELADPAFHQPATVDMLIAGDLFPYIYTGEKIFPAESGMPVAMNSIFGYIIGGAAVINNENQKVSMVTTAAEGVTESIFCGFTGTMNMDQIMNRFWERAGFVLRKWSSNCSQVLAAVPKDHRETPIEFDEEQNFALKVLGLQWQPATDCFSFCTATVEKEITKRTILSQIGRLFDPLGFVSPCVFYAKCFMQKLWAVQLDWDQSLPPHLESEWITFVKELPLLSELQHERHVMVKQSIIYRILGFCDASTLGYAAVVYLFTENENNTLSVPRLELMAAHLLAKLVKYVALILQERDVCIDDILLFTDSSVVLAWLNTPSYKLKIFVATRVTKILETFPANHWRHVSGESNPADVCSRGALPSTLMAMSEWLHGPHWILNEKWPVRNIDEFRDENPPEMKHSTESKNLLSAEPPSNDIYDLTQRHSNFNKLLNVVARVHQFIRYCRTTVSQRTGLSIVDLRKAHDSLIKSVQQHHFCDDMAALSKGQQPQQSLRKLNPFIDPLGFLRVGGRLSQTNMSYEKKHPVLVPKKSNFTYTLIDYYHILYLHVGPRTLQGILSQKYWIISARSVIRTRTMKCISCFKVRPTTRQPIMGQLPKFRTQDIHTFHTPAIFYHKTSKIRRARDIVFNSGCAGRGGGKKVSGFGGRHLDWNLGTRLTAPGHQLVWHSVPSAILVSP
ncbi:pao retrotransposon peptidase domain-containing protein [Phthorimaea operculella]|nr:pao retrotransposon peptidase domain-containing protein [Phthorimaea operculella]